MATILPRVPNAPPVTGFHRLASPPHSSLLFAVYHFSLGPALLGGALAPSLVVGSAHLRPTPLTPVLEYRHRVLTRSVAYDGTRGRRCVVGRVWACGWRVGSWRLHRPFSLRAFSNSCMCVCTVRNGHIKRITDQDIQSSVLEIMGTNVSTNYITCPADPKKTLGIKLPFLVMIIKNLKKYFTFEVQVLDDKNVRRRFRASNYQVGYASCREMSTPTAHADLSWRRINFFNVAFRCNGSLPLESSRSSAPCPCDLTKDGTRFNST